MRLPPVQFRLVPMPLRAAAFLSLASVAGCTCGKYRETPPRTAEIVDAPSIVEASVADAAPDVLTADEQNRAREARYRVALEKGHRETTAKRYEAAIAAFEEALDAKPHDANALYGRAHARLLTQDYAVADADLDEVADIILERETSLRANVHFDHALVAQARGDDARASRELEWVERAEPNAEMRTRLPALKSAVAKARRAEVTLRGCGARVRSSAFPLAASPSLKTVAGRDEPRCAPRCNADTFRWVDEGPPQSSDCKEKCDPSGSAPFVVGFKGENGSGGLVLVSPARGRLLSVPIADVSPARCGSGSYAVTLAEEDGFLHARIRHEFMGPGSIDACNGPNVSTVDHVIVSLAARSVVARVTEERETSVTAKKAGIALRGGGCDEVVPWEASDVDGGAATEGDSGDR